MIDFSPTEDEQAILDQVRKFSLTELRPKLREYENKHGIPEDVMKKFHEMGLSTLDIPQEYGGMGLGMVTSVLVQEELSYGDVGIALALPGPCYAAHAVLCFGNEEQKKRLLSPFSSPDAFNKIGTICIAEEKAGANVLEFETTAKKDGNKYILNGKKYMILSGGIASLHIIFAVIDKNKGWDGIGVFAVETPAQGLKTVRTLDLLGLNTVQVNEIAIENLVVSEQNLLNSGNFKENYNKMFERIRTIHAARCVGLAKAALDYAVKYANEREAFGKPIGQHQGLSFILADMATEVDAARWLVWEAASTIDKGKSAFKEASMAFVQANEAAMFVTNNAVQILGGHGYIQDHPVEKWMRDAKTMALMVGSTQSQNQLLFDNLAGIEA
jgi:acyl-CoA dehydrogenase